MRGTTLYADVLLAGTNCRSPVGGQGLTHSGVPRSIRAALIGLAASGCTDQPVPLPSVPSVQLTYHAERDHEPGRGTLSCLVRDTGGGLRSAALSGLSVDVRTSIAGGADTLTAAVSGLAQGQYDFVCTADDHQGRTARDTVHITVLADVLLTNALTVTAQNGHWQLSQTAVVDPSGADVLYAVVILGRDTVSIGPRTTPVDTTLTLPEGVVAVLSIIRSGVDADTVTHRIAQRVADSVATSSRPPITQSVTRNGTTFEYASSGHAPPATLAVVRMPDDTIYHGPVPGDTTFAGTTQGHDLGLFKGFYLFHIHGGRPGETGDIVLDSIINLDPQVDLSEVDATLTTGGHITITLPAPSDPNREDHPTFVQATPSGGKVAAALSGDTLSVTALSDSTGPYQINLVAGDSTTGVVVAVLHGTVDSLSAAAAAAAAQQALTDSTGFKPGYEDVAVVGGASSVEADLVGDDAVKNPLLAVNFATKHLGWYYQFKRRLNEKFGIAFGIDFNVLNQFSSYSSSDQQAASGVFRIFGGWRAFGTAQTTSGNVIYKIENRHRLGAGITPNQLGSDGGSSLSTASFKDWGWGMTALYWKQTFKGRRYNIVVGEMNPSSFADVYLLHSTWKNFMNQAFYNNPANGLPAQGIGVAATAGLMGNWYASAGLHDANGSPTSLGVDTFFEDREYYTWIETGLRLGAGTNHAETVHVNAWHQDPRVEAGVEESWGLTFSASTVMARRWIPFLRAGYSEGDAAKVRFIVAGGVGLRLRGSDFLGVATSWSGPIDPTLRNQMTFEALYRLQLTQNMTLTPDLQFTIHPSLTLARDVLAVLGVLRMRIAL